jgi:torulene dioxygenase
MLIQYVKFDVVREERKPISLPVTGEIPAYAAGALYRNGPGARQLYANGELKYSVSHWFDGFSQLHKFELIPENEHVTTVMYSSRSSVDTLMEQLTETGRFDGYTFAQKRDPCMGLFRKAMCLFTPVPTQTPSTTNIPVTISANTVGYPQDSLPVGHKAGAMSYLVARTDEGTIKALDAETLEPIGVAHQSKLHPLLRGPLSASHAKSDPATGDVFNYNLDLGRFATYRVFRTSTKTGKTDILATITGPDVPPAYMHSFFLTENYVILAVWSAHLLAGGIKVLWEKNVLDAIAPFDGSKSVQWYVVDRRHGCGVIARFESPAAFSFHAINAYEQPSEDGNGNIDIICDLIEHKNLDVLHAFYYEHLRSSSSRARSFAGYEHGFASYKLASVSDAVSLVPITASQREHKSPLPSPRQAELLGRIQSGNVGDMPTINARFACKSYRYFWNGTVRFPSSTFFDGLAKIDRMTGEEATVWDNPPGHFPGEGIFIPNPDGTAEDDGVLLTVVLDGFRGSSYLLCLDARTMKERGRADCRGALPFMFHGQHVPVSGAKPLDV